jgi:arabinogalactan oligomer/maltooligosaccharide transport system permease protein
VKVLYLRKVTKSAKYLVVALVSAILGLLIQSAFAQKQYEIAAFLAIALVAIAVVYLTDISVPFKFLLPGMLFLFAFVVGPIVYTVVMSTFQYQNGNYISKDESIAQIKLLGVEGDEAGTSFDVVVGRDGSGNLAILASDILNKQYFLSTAQSKTDLFLGDLEINSDGVATSAPDFVSIQDSERGALDSELSSTRFKYNNEYFVIMEGSGVGVVKRQVLEYRSSSDTFLNLIDGRTYSDNGRGNYADTSNLTDILQPGWRSPIWFSNYASLFTDSQIREPLLRVFTWTMIFASLTVLTQFALGLLLAIAMNRPLRGRRIYRSIFILPYAMPSIMSILIWAGMFDTEFGAINNLFGTEIAWFQSSLFARTAVIIVNLWLGFPYFYLICSGALQAIPADLSEAAAIDGANPRQIFSKITLPLLLQVVAPLLVASFAFNFNNFNLIYLLTGGGPSSPLDGDIAGATDILISYTYKIAFVGDVQNLGLASAISVVIFVIIAAISLYGVRKSKVLDSFS